MPKLLPYPRLIGLLLVVFAVATVLIAWPALLQRADTDDSLDQTTAPAVAPAPPIESKVTFLVGGDMMFGRFIAHSFGQDKLTNAVVDLGEGLFAGRDVGLVNLEGPISDGPVPDVTEPNNLIFNFAPKTVDALKYLGVNVASLANNHSHNAGDKGLETTLRLLKEADITPLGGPADSDVARVAAVAGQNLTLVVIGVVGIAGDPMPDLASIITEYQADPNNRILIFPHWGNEYQDVHSQRQETLAHTWIDAGADLVIGAHPHVVQDAELYQGVPIIYSLGNLLFDQTFSAETQQGMLIGGEFTRDGLQLYALQTESQRLKPRLTTGSNKAKRVDALMAPFADQRVETADGPVFNFPTP